MSFVLPSELGHIAISKDVCIYKIYCQQKSDGVDSISAGGQRAFGEKENLEALGQM